MTERSGHILVVDDNRINRLKLSHTLEQQGHTVWLAENGLQALEMLEQQAFDVVLLDLIMPEMDGYETLRRIKADATLRHIPVIVITALDELESAVRCIEMGAEDYLPKSVQPGVPESQARGILAQKETPRPRASLPATGTHVAPEREARHARQVERRHGARVKQPSGSGGAGCRAGAVSLRAAPEGTSGTRCRCTRGVQLSALEQLSRVMRSCKERVSALDALTRSDREVALEDWLAAHGIANPWELSPTLVTMGYGLDKLEQLEVTFEAERLNALLTWLTERLYRLQRA